VSADAAARLRQLAYAIWAVDPDEPWRVRADDGYPVAFCGTLPGHPDPNPKRAERHAAQIASLPELARLAADMADALAAVRTYSAPAGWGYARRALLARLDTLTKENEA
jgi:hypothetical protein